MSALDRMGSLLARIDDVRDQVPDYRGKVALGFIRTDVARLIQAHERLTAELEEARTEILRLRAESAPAEYLARARDFRREVEG